MPPHRPCAHVSHIFLGLEEEEQARDVIRYATTHMLEDFRSCLARTVDGCITNGSRDFRHVFGAQRHTPQQLKAAERGQVFCLPRDKEVAKLFWHGLSSHLRLLLPSEHRDFEEPFHLVFKAINQKVGECFLRDSLILSWAL